MVFAGYDWKTDCENPIYYKNLNGSNIKFVNSTATTLSGIASAASIAEADIPNIKLCVQVRKNWYKIVLQ